MAELFSNEPLRDESYVSASELSVPQAVEAGAIVREAVQRGVLSVEHPPPCRPEERRMTFVHPNSADPPLYWLLGPSVLE